MTDEDLEQDIAGAKRLIRHALVVTLVAVLVAAIVLGIDMGIKRAVLDEVGKARSILEEFRRLADGAKAAGEAGAGSSNGVGAGDDVVHAAGAGTVLAAAEVAGEPAPDDEQAGVAGGSSGDG